MHGSRIFLLNCLGMLGIGRDRTHLVEPGKIFPEVGGTLSSRQGVVWVSQLSSGAGLFLGLIDPVEGDLHGEPAKGTVPLTPATWLTLMEKTKLSIRSLGKFCQRGASSVCLSEFPRDSVFS